MELTVRAPSEDTPTFVFSLVTSTNATGQEQTSHARMRHSFLQPRVLHFNSGPLPLELIAKGEIGWWGPI